ncbi:MAG: hypothetical protein E7375_03975 [Clostridiales bacterium]|nr:hypothetical protein [Clostridiales bacterium]
MKFYNGSKKVKYSGKRLTISACGEELCGVQFFNSLLWERGEVADTKEPVTGVFDSNGTEIFVFYGGEGGTDYFKLWFEQIAPRAYHISALTPDIGISFSPDLVKELEELKKIIYEPFIEAIARDLSKVNVLPVKCFEDYPQLQTEILARYRELKMEEILNLPAEEDCQPIYDKTEKELEAFGVVMQNVEKTLKTKRAMETLFEKK